jgi:hypothetical protein
MKQFEYNESGIFTNPNTVFYNEPSLCRITILTACYPNGKWVFGYELIYGANKTPDMYASHPCMKMPFDLVYKSEINARKAAAKSIKEQLTKIGRGSTKCLDWLNTLILRQLNLFDK